METTNVQPEGEPGKVSTTTAVVPPARPLAAMEASAKDTPVSRLMLWLRYLGFGLYTMFCISSAVGLIYLVYLGGSWLVTYVGDYLSGHQEAVALWGQRFGIAVAGSFGTALATLIVARIRADMEIRDLVKRLLIVDKLIETLEPSPGQNLSVDSRMRLEGCSALFRNEKMDKIVKHIDPLLVAAVLRVAGLIEVIRSDAAATREGSRRSGRPPTQEETVELSSLIGSLKDAPLKQIREDLLGGLFFPWLTRGLEGPASKGVEELRDKLFSEKDDG